MKVFDAPTSVPAWAELLAPFAVAPAADRHERVTRVDSFDWRLYQAGLALELVERADGVDARLCDLRGHAFEAEALAARPRFAGDLGDGSLAEQVAPLLAPRALLPLVTFDRHARTWEVRDRGGKLVAHLALEREVEVATGSPIPSRLRVVPVLGYDGEAGELADRLHEAGLARLERSPLAAALEVVGRTPLDTLPPRPALDPELPTEVAVRRVLGSLVAMIRLQETGIREDLDAEFLHDLRVAIRRARILANRWKRAVPDLVLVVAPLRELGQPTGRLRDLDVQLEALAGAEAWVSPDLRAALTPLRRYVAARRQEAHHAVVALLDAPRYAAIVADLAAYADLAETTSGSPAARLPIAVTARAATWRSFRRLVRDARGAIETSEATHLHELRKTGKKLRYLLEAFGAVACEAGDDAIAELARPLRRLLGELGGLQDLAVQRASLLRIADEMARAGQAEAHTLLALGQILAGMDRAQRRGARRVARRITRLVRRRTRRLAASLFEPASEEATT